MNGDNPTPTGGRAEPTSAHHQEIAEFMHGWTEAILTNSPAQMAPFTTEDWVLIDGPGVITRDTFHAVVASGELRHTTMTHRILGISDFGAVTVVRTHGRNSGTYAGSPISADEWTTNLLVRDGHRWRCVLTQLTPRTSGD